MPWVLAFGPHPTRVSRRTERNHDGHSDPNELVPLQELGIVSIELTVKDDQKRDPFGNVFRYRSSVKVLNRNGATVSRLAYDVFLASR